MSDKENGFYPQRPDFSFVSVQIFQYFFHHYLLKRIQKDLVVLK
jgi:hypothetical protein